MCHIYINLKGRDPEGIVEPSDYEKVQRQVIDALYRWTDPDTGNRPVSLALTKTDARILGLHGERVGDVIYALYTDAGNQHGQQLSASESTVGKLKSLLVLSGPGARQGYCMDRTCWLTDVVPTICYLCHWPVPANAEGSVIYQALTNPSNLSPDARSLKTSGEGAITAMEENEEKPEQKADGKEGEKGGQPGGEDTKESEKKRKMNERLKKLGYDLPY
jgi:hypothetical protein